MCGVVGIVSKEPVNQAIYDALTVMQHRGQDSAGIVTWGKDGLKQRKTNGLVRDVFRTRHMVRLSGNVGIGHVRYPTAGGARSAEAQPFYVNSPYGIVLAHNGNLTNAEELKRDLEDIAARAAGMRQAHDALTAQLSDLTAAATAFCVMHQGAVPVFADLDPRTFNIDPESIRQRITPLTRAIIPVGLYGLSADMDPIMDIAREHDLLFLVDARDGCTSADLDSGERLEGFGVRLADRESIQLMLGNLAMQIEMAQAAWAGKPALAMISSARSRRK